MDLELGVDTRRGHAGEEGVEEEDGGGECEGEDGEVVREEVGAGMGSGKR